MLNRIRVEEHTAEDILALKDRVFPRSSEKVQKSSFFIAPLRVNVAKWNTEKLNENKGGAFTIKAIHLDAMRRHETPLRTVYRPERRYRGFNRIYGHTDLEEGMPCYDHN